MDRLIETLKPNLLLVNLMASFLVFVLAREAGVDHLVAILGIAANFIGGQVTVMFLLLKPPPNPEVDRQFAEGLIAALSGKPPPASPNRASKSVTGFLTFLVLVAAALSAFVVVFPGIPLEVAVVVVGATIGMITATAGKYLEDEPQVTVPQSALTLALEHLARAAARDARAQESKS